MNLKNILSLKESITKQLDTLEKVLSIEKNKNEILIQGKLTDFSDMNEELAILLPIIETIESERQSYLDAFVKDNPEIHLKSPITFLNILNLIKQENIYQEMFDLYQKIKETVDDIKHYTAMNKSLIEVALNVLNLSLSEDKKDIDYTGKTEGQASSILLNKII